MICHDGKVSLYCFFSTAVIFVLLFSSGVVYSFLNEITGGLVLGPLLYFVAANVIVRFTCGAAYQVAIRAVLLGFIFALGLIFNMYGPTNLAIFGIYMCVMAAFHYSEYLSIALIQPKLVSVDSFVLNHSREYTVAAVTSWIEFALESFFFPGIKSVSWPSHMGLGICIGGEILRKLAMFTAKSNFNHLVQCEKADDHVLVTHGVYHLFRHPSYVGWFYWSIGTQIILLNPFSLIAYAYASWHFFKERINIEEITLLNFFGQQYCDYQQKVGTGLPFIEGYRIKP